MNVIEYIEAMPDDRKIMVNHLRDVVKHNLPFGFDEQIRYGMIVYEVPHTIYPKGYHANPKVGLPHIAIANQKHSVSFYHMGMYARPELLEWFMEEYQKNSIKKLDMGKSCIRFKKENDIPYPVITELVSKLTVEDVIHFYEDMKKRGNHNE